MVGQQFSFSSFFEANQGTMNGIVLLHDTPSSHFILHFFPFDSPLLEGNIPKA